MSDVKLVEGVAFKLEPGKKYLFIFDRTMISKSDVAKLGDVLHKDGIQGVSVLLHGDPKTVQIIEDNRKATEAKSEVSAP